MAKLRPLPSVRNRLNLPKQKLNFGGGVNNTDPEQQLNRNQVAAGLNMFLDRKGGAYNRNGSTRKNQFLGSATGILNLFNFTNNASTQTFMAVHDTKLYYDNSGTWTEISGITYTTNKRAEGVFYSETNKFYVTNGTDDVSVITSSASATTDANFKKGTWVESFDGRLVTGGVASQENRLWVTDLGVDTFGANNYIDLEGKILNGKSIQQRNMLVWTDRKLVKIPGFATTPNASGPEAVFDVADVSLVGTRAIALHGNQDKVAYYIALDEKNTVDVYACDGVRNVSIGSPLIKEYLQNLAGSSLSTICAVADGQFIRFSCPPTGETTNLREYIFDTINKTWQTEFRYGFPVNCYAIIKTSGVRELYVGHETVGQVQKLNAQRYDELIDQSYTTGRDADQNMSSSTSTRVAQGFELSVDTPETRLVTGGAILMKKNTGTTAELTIRIETNSAGVPSGTLANANATTTISAFSGTTYEYRPFTFSTPFSLDGGTAYHIVVKHTTEGSGTSQYHVGVDSSSPTYANGTLSTYNGTTWSAVSGSDSLFVLYVEEPIESFVAQTTNLDEPLFPKKPQQVLIEGQSATGIIAKLGISYEGISGEFSNVDIPLTGKGAKWSDDDTDTDSDRLVWASSVEETSASNIRWNSGTTIYSLSVFPDAYVPPSRYLTYRFYFKGIGEFRINDYIPYFEVIPTTVLT